MDNLKIFHDQILKKNVYELLILFLVIKGHGQGRKMLQGHKSYEK